MTQKHLLIVDDDKHIQERLTAYCRHYFDVSITYCDDGVAALETLNQQTFDLIFLDYDMPIMTGSDFLATLYQRHPNHKTPVIVCSSYGATDSVWDDAKNQNQIHGFLLKMFTRDEVFSALASVGFQKS